MKKVTNAYIIGIAFVALLAMVLTHYNLQQTRKLLTKQELEEKYWQYYEQKENSEIEYKERNGLSAKEYWEREDKIHD